jgi:signal transduction histidine kinase
MMISVKTSLALFLSTVLLLCASCVKDNVYVSVSSVAETWLNAKIAIQAEESSSAIKIDVFIKTLKGFLASPIGTLYKVQQPEEMRLLENLFVSAENLKAAMQNNNEAVIFPLIIEIDRSVNLLQNIDTNISDVTQRNYFYLFFSFTILIITIIAAITFLYRGLEKSAAREMRSITFSRETVMAQEEERSRIAKELHDTVAQDLWRISFQIDSIGKTKKAEERNRLCAETVKGQHELMKQVRSICDNLIPPDFSRRGLIDAIRLFCYNFERRTGIVCKALLDEPINLGSLKNSVQLQCFRIFQECFTNIEKHSGATEASVFIKMKNDDTLVISIRDNGKGFSPPNRESSQQMKDEGHYGLWSLFERAVLLEGKLNIESAPGKGCVIQLEVPMFSYRKIGETEP